jgi:hypothetical protein
MDFTPRLLNQRMIMAVKEVFPVPPFPEMAIIDMTN